MKKAIAATLLALSLMAVMGCATTMPVAATSNPVGKKTGTATEMWILTYPPFASSANGGIANAAKNGGISKISTVDCKVRTYFVVSWVDTIVTGE